MDTLEIEIIRQNIIDPTIEVGSGCDWKGGGKEPQWDNPKSHKAYDHIIRHHGSKLKPDNLKGRSASNSQDQGQWLNEEYWVMAEKLIPKYFGTYTVKFNLPIGRVYHPNGAITEDVCYAEIGRNFDGTIKYAYPVIYSE